MRNTRSRAIWFVTAVMSAAMVFAVANGATRSASDVFTPLVVSPLIDRTTIFLGTDGKQHLVYELVLTNTSPTPATLKKVDVLSGGVPEKPLASFEGESLLKHLRTLRNTLAANAEIPFNETRLVLIDFTIDGNAPAPQRLLHHLDLLGAGSPSPKAQAPIAMSYTVAPVEVGKRLITIGPPLAGKGWLVVNGCCEPGGAHRSTGLPVNGKIHFAQRFAIDYMRLDSEGRMVHGDPGDVRNYPDYGADVLAVADGKVVETLSTLEDQKPGTMPDPKTITLENVDGNHVVQDLGGGLFGFYAHLQKDSVTVKAGDMVKRGQVLGKLGNTGNTSAPHLHFHVMEGSSVLGSSGVPYLYDSFALEGQVSEKQYADAPGVEGVWNQGMLPKASPRRQQFPLDLNIVEFSPVK